MTREESAFDRLFRVIVEKANPAATDDELGELAVRAADEAAAVFSRLLRKGTPAMLIANRATRAGFEERLRDPWGPAFDAFEALYTASAEAGEMYIERVDEANAEDDHLFTALVGLHIRACHVASEIQALLHTGHGSGALSRWRTLHEIAVTMGFLEQGPDTAQRYLDHDGIRSWREARDYQTHARRIGERRFTKAEMAEMGAEHDRLIAKYGKPYGTEWGWAADALGVKRPTFRTIEEAVDLSHWRPHYAWASDSLHAGPKAMFYRLGTEDAIEMPLAGPSNLGLDDPGMAASISLAIATTELLAHRADMECLVTMRVILDLERRSTRAFAKAGRLLRRRIEEAARDEGEPSED